MEEVYYKRGEGVLIIDRGAWAAGEDYEIGNWVQDVAGYYCTAPHTSSAATEPGVGANWTDVWKPMGTVTGTNQSTYFKAQDTAPYLRLIDGSSNDALIRLVAGVLQFYDNVGAALRASINILNGNMAITGTLAVTGAATLTGGIATVKTDNQIQVNHIGGYALSGTWTPTLVSNVPTLTRTASTTDGLYIIPIHLPKRTASSKGAKLKSVTISYVTGGTVDTAADTLYFYIIKNTMPSNGSEATGAIIAGDADSDYDAGHDTKAERLAAGNHTCTVTIPVGEQAYAADLETYWLEVYVDDASTANLTFKVTGIVANYESAEY